VVTHGHADHARWGSKRYLCTAEGAGVLRARLGADAALDPLAWGESRSVNGVRISLHPAGHILGSAQVRVEHRGEVWVVTGDYKHRGDPTCTPYEPVRCHALITESTFGLPVYRWPDPDAVFREIRSWWARNRAEGRTSVVFSYSLGKAQRVLAGLEADGPILVHGAVKRMNEVYEEAGVSLPAHAYASVEESRETRGEALVVAPPSAGGSTWMRRFGAVSTAFASGWMMVRGNRRRRAADRGFVLSDHVDWPALLRTVEESGAERVGITHGFVTTVVRYLRDRGLDAWEVPTRFSVEGEGEDGATPEEEAGEDGDPTRDDGDPAGGDGDLARGGTRGEGPP
jgi:putative mRNA 3-end processing factor